MNEKQRLYRARRRAAGILRSSGYRVVSLSEDPVFDIEAARKSELRKIVVRITPISKDAMIEIAGTVFPFECRKEIWTRNEKGPGFVIEHVL